MMMKRLITCQLSVVMGLVLLFGGAHVNAQTGLAAGYQQYVVPGETDDIWNLMFDLDNTSLNPASGMHAVISVTATADGTTIYYDHWENGYTFDASDPANTNDQMITLDEGEVHYFESSAIPVLPRGSATYYDGGDMVYRRG